MLAARQSAHPMPQMLQRLLLLVCQLRHGTGCAGQGRAESGGRQGSAEWGASRAAGVCGGQWVRVRVREGGNVPRSRRSAVRGGAVAWGAWDAGMSAGVASA